MKAGGGKENLYREKPEVVAKLLALLEKDVKRGRIRKAPPRKTTREDRPLEERAT